MKKSLLLFTFLISAVSFAQTFDQVSTSYPTCFGMCDGSVVFSTTTTPGPFTAILTNSSSCPNATVQSSTGNTITISGLCTCVSDYSVSFYNASMVLVGLELLQIPITSTVALTLQTPTVNPAACSTCCDGSVFVSYSGGYSPPPNNATVTLDGNDVGANYFPIPTVCVGQHTVCVTDLANCMACNSFSVGFVPNVGLMENAENSPFSVFPNPANDKITFISNGEDLPQSLKFLNVNGKESYSFRIPSNQNHKFELNISDIPNGVYIIEMPSRFGILRQKLIKMN